MKGGSAPHMRIGCNRFMVTGYVSNRALCVLPINLCCPYSSILVIAPWTVVCGCE